MKLRKLLFPLAGSAALCVGMAAYAEDLVVISNPGVTVTADDVRDIFTGEKQVAGATKLAPVDNASAQPVFLAKIMKMDGTKYGASWTKKAFRDGVNPPPVKATDAEVIDFVKRTPGAVGYVKSAPAGGVTVVDRK